MAYILPLWLVPNPVGDVLKHDVARTLDPDPLVFEGDVRRLSMGHFTSAVLPELQKFRTHLESQGIQIENRVKRDQDYLRAQLFIHYPLSSVSVLDVCYHYSDQCLIITGQLGEKTSEVAYKFSLADLNEVTQVESYEIIEAFVTSVFNEFSLCEFVTEEEVEI